MSSRRAVRRPLVALLVGVLVGGGLMAVTPAGAEVSNAVATNWNKIWNKELKPQADQRYYTKKKSNKRYYTKSDSDAKYQAEGLGLTKAESVHQVPRPTRSTRSPARRTPRPRATRSTSRRRSSRGWLGAFGAVSRAAAVRDRLASRCRAVGCAGVPLHRRRRGRTCRECPGTAAAPARSGHLCISSRRTSANVNARLLLTFNAIDCDLGAGSDLAGSTIALGFAASRRRPRQRARPVLARASTPVGSARRRRRTRSPGAPGGTP